MNTGINIGNTHITIAQFSKKITKIKKLPTEKINKYLKPSKLKGKIYIASVVPSITEVFLKTVKNHPVKIFTYKDIPIKIKVKNPGSTGIDRILNCFAAFEKFRLPCLIIDAGSAITADVVNEKGEFEGGIILPGITLMEKSLKELAGLKNFRLTGKTSLIGKGTDSAVSSGIYLGLKFIIEGYWAEMKEKYPGVKLIFTGGDGRELCKKTGKGVYYENLTITGIQKIADKNSFSE
ncbi:MAG: type III pantothenate kinase [Candidatus Omnitrophica bacterium]|nr:type III pantothenate kinase [Candidatus Omnitrophota bacterium]